MRVTEGIRLNSRNIVRELGFLNKFPKDEDISASQIHIMIELEKYSSLKGSQLCDLMCLDKSTISRSTKILLEKGWITSVGDASDARSKVYRLTEAGLERVRLSNDRAHKIINAALGTLKPDEHMAIVKGLQLYAEALRKTGNQQYYISRLKDSDSKEKLAEFVSHIQRQEFGIPATPEINASLYKPEDYFRGQEKGLINFWVSRSAQTQEIVGTIGLSKVTDKIAELKKFFVAPAYRGGTVAMDLLGKVIEQARLEGYASLYLGTVDKLQAAQKFYQKHGFKRIKVTELPKEFSICELDTDFFYRDLK